MQPGVEYVIAVDNVANYVKGYHQLDHGKVRRGSRWWRKSSGTRPVPSCHQASNSQYRSAEHLLPASCLCGVR